jgi:hypothetical protein
MNTVFVLVAVTLLLSVIALRKKWRDELTYLKAQKGNRHLDAREIAEERLVEQIVRQANFKAPAAKGFSAQLDRRHTVLAWKGRAQ